MAADLFDRVASAAMAHAPFKAKRRGDWIDIRCPRHDDRKASAWINGTSWGCLACDFTEPLGTLAEYLGIELEPRGYTVGEYAREKGFAEADIRKFGLEDHTERGRTIVAIPYYDAAGKVLRRKFRAANGRKWWEGKNQAIHLYGLDRLGGLQDGAEVLIVEGESDCHAAWLEGFNAVGVPGATVWRDDWKPHLEGFELVVWEEPDKGGPQLVASIASSFPDAKVIHDPPAKDIADLRKQKRDKFGAALRSLIAAASKIGTPKPPVAFDPLLGAHLDRLLEHKMAPIDAVATPFPSWNACCCDDGGRIGLARGWHVIGAAKSGRGKSILALNMAAHAVRCSERVCFISLEMSQPELQTRMLSIASGQPVRQLERGREFSIEAFRTAARALDELHERTGGVFWSNRQPINSIRQVIDSVRYNYEVHGSRFFIVDYIQLAGNAADLESIINVSGALREITNELNVVTFGLSQFNRSTSSSKERPTKEGLMGGSPLENDSDQVILVDHSRANDLGSPADGWSTYLILDKNRHGALVDIPVAFERRALRFREMLQDELSSEQAAQ